MRTEGKGVGAPAPAGLRGGGRFYLLLALGVVAACAGYAALVLYTGSWPEVAALRSFYVWHPRACTEAEFSALRRGLVGLAAGAGLLGGALSLGRAGRAELAGLGREGWALGRGLWAGWQGLRPGQRRLAGAALLALTALRAYYSVIMEPFDDAVSYEVFVRAHLLPLSACYPMPNNHVLSNTIDWLFYQVSPGFWWSMRLPVLLVSTGATAGWFLALLRRSSFRIALLAVTLFSVVQISFYHAASGRGYWLLVGLVAVGFFAVLELAEATPAAPGRARAAWAALVLSGVLGLYTVPTHAYFLFSAYGWLGLQLLRRRAWGGLGRAVALGGLTLLGAALLYAPLLLVSGPRLLLGNDYVRALTAAEFWRGLPHYLWETEGTLAGHRWLGAGPLLLGLGILGALGQRARAGRLPASQARVVQRLALPGLWFMASPYALALVQQVYPPERTLFYKAQFLFVLLAMGADWALRTAATPAARHRLRVALVAGSLAFATGEIWLVNRFNKSRRDAWVPFEASVVWLASQPAGPVLVPAPPQRILLRFYVHAYYQGRAWQLDDHPRPGVHYRYLVSKPGKHAIPGGPAVGGAPTFANAAVDIFVAP